jgi:hypothetical protein
MKQTPQRPSQANVIAPRTPLASLTGAIRSCIQSVLQLLKGVSARTDAPPSNQARALQIARYGLVLMDVDGQVVWTGEWDSGGVFEFRPRQRLFVRCAFTNHSTSETEISEYEIELMSEDGSIVERFNTSFGDSLIIPPGASKQFPAEWRM